VRPPTALPTLIVLALFAFEAAAAEADVVTFANGDRLSGKVLGMAGGNLRLKTEHCGTVEIQWKEIMSLSTEKEFRLEQENGEPLKGKLVLKDGSLEIQEDPTTPPVRVSPSDVSRVEPPGTRWSGSLTLSIRAEDGNSHSTDIFSTAELIRDGEVDKFLVRGHLTYGTENGALTDQAAYGLFQYNLNLSRDWYLYAGTETTTDKFEDLSFRTVISMGPGYIIVKSDGIEAWLDAGPSYVHEVQSSGVKDSWVGARVAGHLKVKLPLGLEVRDDVLFYPNFNQSTNWQLHNEVTVTTSLGAGWSLSLSIISDLDHDPIPGKERLDDLYALGLQYKF